jgi:autoinducer 2-binding protein LuxP
MKLKITRSLAIGGIMALVLVGCAAQSDVGAPGSAAPAAPEAPAAAETQTESESWTMLEYFEEFPAEFDKLVALRAISSTDAVPVSVEVDRQFIAFVSPSFNLSEGWARGRIAFEKRLQELKIPFKIDDYGSTDQDHQRQSAHVDAIIAAGTDYYDFVVFGPTELGIQKLNIERMVEAGLPVVIWNYNTPLKEWGSDRQPLSYVGFDHAEGANLLCEWTLKRTGGVGNFAVMRFIPGFIDDQRNGIFSDCVTKGGMVNVYDHFAEGDNEKAYQGTQSTLTAYPDIVMIHAGNTATALGAANAAEERGVAGKILINGWGGGRSELDKILAGSLQVTPLRLQDDFGVYPAEMLKMLLEGKRDEIPLVGAGDYLLIDDSFSAQDMLDATEYAFRYSQTLER